MSGDRGDRLYPARPLVGVAAVIWDGARVLLERRGQPPAQGLWSLPGGLIELGEAAESALQREVREECGIEIEVGPLLGIFQPIHRDPDGRVRYHFVVIDFLAYYRGGILRAGDDAAEVRWATPEELAHLEMAAETRAMVDRALALIAAQQKSSPTPA